MKVLIVIPAVGNVYGGTSKYVFDLATELGKSKISIDIVTTNANGKTNLDVPCGKWLQNTNYRIQYFPYWGWRDYKISFSMAKWFFHNIADYDLVQTNAVFSLSNLPAYWFCQRHKIPYVVIPHGMLEPWALSYKAWKKKLFYNFLEKPALNNAQVIQTLASSEAKNVKSLSLMSPLVVIPNGINRHEVDQLASPEIFYHQFPKTRNKTLILFLGRIDPKKGLDLLAIAFEKIHSKFPQTHLVIAGPDNIDFLATAKSYFVEAGCINAVSFTGMLIGELKYSVLAAANLYVAPSYSEGFSISVLEGMASGLPCVITTACNFPEAAQAKAAYVVDIDANAIAEAIVQCLQSPQEAQEMGARAREFIFNNYTWNSISTKTIKLYREIVQNQMSLMYE